MFADLRCHRCGYDLRAHPPEGRCPECGTPVAESRREAAIPLRPAWGESDPRWRRRVLAGVWVLLLLPLMDTLKTFGWAASVPVPGVFDVHNASRTLDETLLCSPGTYLPLIFCIGVVLLFSKERGRRRNQLDWTRRWGVLCSYVVLLLSIVSVLFICALVLAGISAVFLCMPMKYQPAVTPMFAALSAGYLRYGPYPNPIVGAVCPAFSSTAILLACIALFDALRSAGPRWLAMILLAPLGLFCLMHLAQALFYGLGFSGMTSVDIARCQLYFWPGALPAYLAGLQRYSGIGVTFGAFFVEAVKWCVVLVVALWLSVAQLAAWWRRKKTSAV
jgi:hypothetical protein